MKNVKKFFKDELIYGDHLVALGGLGIVLSILLILELKIDWLVLLIAYLIILIIYSYNHSRELKFDKESNPERYEHMSSRKHWVKISPYVYIVLLLLALYFTNLNTALLAIFMIVGGILYTVYFKKVPILGFKNYYTSFFWSLIVLLIPFFYEIETITPFLYLVTFIFIRGLVNTIFFDIKDIESDAARGLKTFPVYFGKRKILYILHVVNILSIIPIVLGIINDQLPNSTLILLLTVLNGIYYLTSALNLNKENLRLISYILIDGEYILWPLVVFLVQIFI